MKDETTNIIFPPQFIIEHEAEEKKPENIIERAMYDLETSVSRLQDELRVLGVKNFGKDWMKQIRKKNERTN